MSRRMSRLTLKLLKTRFLKHAFWRYLKRFRTAEKIWKTLIVSKACILTVFETIRNYREMKTLIVSNACILMVLEIIWNWREIMKTRTRVLYHYLKRYLKLQWDSQYKLLSRGVWRRPSFPWKCENNDSNCCILTLFETPFWNCRENFESNEAKWYILNIFETFGRRLLEGSPSANVNLSSETSAYIHVFDGTCKS